MEKGMMFTQCSTFLSTCHKDLVCTRCARILSWIASLNNKIRSLAASFQRFWLKSTTNAPTVSIILFIYSFIWIQLNESRLTTQTTYAHNCEEIKAHIMRDKCCSHSEIFDAVNFQTQRSMWTEINSALT